MLTSDQELLREFIRAGSQPAFQALVERHLPLVFGTACRRLGDAQLAEEVAQNVFIVLARKAGFLGVEVRLAAWLHQTTLLEARHCLRGELRRRQREETAARLGDTMKEDDSRSQILAGLLDEALLELREKDRQVLLLRFFEEKSLRDLGAYFGISEDAAQKRVAKALETLGRAFQRRGYQMPTATVATVIAAARVNTQAMPSGLVSAITQGACQAASVITPAGVAALFAKVMSLTKIQCATVCALVLAAPLAIQWRAAANAITALQPLTQQTTSLGREIAEKEETATGLSARLASLEAQIGELEEARRKALAADAIAAPSNPYRWNEQADYQRLPKSLWARIKLGEFQTKPNGRDRTRREQLPAVAGDGTPSRTLLAALALSPDESTQAAAVTTAAFAEFKTLAAAQSYFTNRSAGRGPPPESHTLYVPPLPEQGKALEERLAAELERVLGAERASFFLRQAGDVTRDYLNDFGRSAKEFRVQRGANSGVDVVETFYRPDGSARLTHFSSEPLTEYPPALLPFVNAWTQTTNPGRSDSK